MKNNFFKLSLLVFALFVAMVGCKPEDEPDPITYEDGVYLVGPSTAYDSIRLIGLMDAGINEATQLEKEGMYEKYISVSATGTGFQLAIVEGGTPKYYGPKTNTVVTLDGTVEAQIIGDVQIGTIDTASGSFTVPADGLYHFVYDETSMTYAIIPVTKWAILGGSVPSSWSDTDMPLKGAFNKSTMEYEVTGLELRLGDFKFRHSAGWKVLVTEEFAGTANNYNINTNFGGVVSGTLPNLTTTLVPGGPNFAFAIANEGLYTVSLKWTAEDGFVSTLTKTGDVTAENPATFVFSLIGSAYMEPDSTSASAWDYDWDLPYTSKDGDVYIYTINSIELLADGEFKVRKDHDWGTNYGFADVTIEGDAANFVDNGGNIKVVATKTYKVEFKLNWADLTKKIVFTAL